MGEDFEPPGRGGTRSPQGKTDDTLDAIRRLIAENGDLRPQVPPNVREARPAAPEAGGPMLVSDTTPGQAVPPREGDKSPPPLVLVSDKGEARGQSPEAADASAKVREPRPAPELDGSPSVTAAQPQPAERTGECLHRDERPDGPVRKLETASATRQAVRRIARTGAGTSAPKRLPRRIAGAAGAAARRAGEGLLRRIGVFLRRRDAPRLLALSTLGLLFVLRPWALPALLLFVLLGVVALYLSLGEERSARLVLRWYEGVRRRDPERAEVLRSRAAAVSRRLASLLQRLPERWTQGLYLPEFEEPQEVPEKMKSDPFERLAEQTRADRGSAA